MSFTKRAMEFARYVVGARRHALTTTTKPTSSEGCSATTATSASDTSKTTRETCHEQSSTSCHMKTTKRSSPTVPSHIKAAGVEVVSHYLRMIREGQSERWAEMCALQCPPGLRGTDRALMQGRYNEQWLDEMPKHQAERILREAKAAGINTSGKFYMSGIADKRAHCDPAAWIDTTGDIKKVAAARNLTVSGIVNHNGTQMPPPRKRISKRLEGRLMREEMRANPKLSKGEAKELVSDKYVPPWKKK